MDEVEGWKKIKREGEERIVDKEINEWGKEKEIIEIEGNNLNGRSKCGKLGIEDDEMCEFKDEKMIEEEEKVEEWIEVGM